MLRTPLAFLNLIHQPTRTMVSVGGIGVAVLLMFMQLGFLGAVARTATGVYDQMEFDLVVRSPEYLHLYEPRSVPEAAMQILAAAPEVADVRPLDVMLAKWQSPEDGSYRGIAVLGIDRHRPAIPLPELAAQRWLLSRPDYVLIDRSSRPDYGPAEGRVFGPADVGRRTELMNRQVTIAGTFLLGTGLAANGAVIVSREGFARAAPGGHADRVSLVLVRLRKGMGHEAAQQALAERLRAGGGQLAHARVLTRQEVLQFELWRWIAQTPIGLIFAMGVALAVVVGAVISYMILASDVLAHLPEYATLKAMGYPSWYLGAVLLRQAWWFAFGAFVPATLAALLLYRVTSDLAGIPISMTLVRLVVVFALAVAMCSAAGLVAARKLAKAEPAKLF